MERKPYEIVNARTGVRFGRKFDTRREAREFIAFLKASTTLRLYWTAKPWPYQHKGE